MTENIFDFDIPVFAKLIADNESFAITTHIKPDGDALGSEIGLAEWLRSIGKTVRVFNHSATPGNYYFLDQENSVIETFDFEKHTEAIMSSDVFMLVDTNDPERSKSLSDLLVAHKHPILIDHHLSPKEFAKERFVDTDATSTGELVYRLVLGSMASLGGTISPKAAQALFVAIMTDTGSFRFPRTKSETFRIAADLIEKGADPVTAYDRTYNTAKASRLLLIGKLLASVEFAYDNRLALTSITRADIEETGASEEDVDGFSQFPMQVESLEITAFLLELKDGWKLSFRSKGTKSASQLAQAFGGNGHFHAAGARIHDTYSLAELKMKVKTFAEMQF